MNERMAGGERNGQAQSGRMPLRGEELRRGEVTRGEKFRGDFGSASRCGARDIGTEGVAMSGHANASRWREAPARRKSLRGQLGEHFGASRDAEFGFVVPLAGVRSALPLLELDGGDGIAFLVVEEFLERFGVPAANLGGRASDEQKCFAPTFDHRHCPPALCFGFRHDEHLVPSLSHLDRHPLGDGGYVVDSAGSRQEKSSKTANRLKFEGCSLSGTEDDSPATEVIGGRFRPSRGHPE